MKSLKFQNDNYAIVVGPSNSRKQRKSNQLLIKKLTTRIRGTDESKSIDLKKTSIT